MEIELPCLCRQTNDRVFPQDISSRLNSAGLFVMRTDAQPWCACASQKLITQWAWTYPGLASAFDLFSAAPRRNMHAVAFIFDWATGPYGELENDCHAAIAAILLARLPCSRFVPTERA
ncbi:hypothetical protein EAS61_34935 [Bradyrhizobium zhanjiangense]|uniref:Uncharacterized protein n=1 Tax=Bradyrhizobium zhanjiangense TaxID=1325107 RepID=A0A4Q0QA19_9BRAD|nr:hypothetical protein EAS61_34935 [Bradyrhizobium zhanjiangense]